MADLICGVATGEEVLTAINLNTAKETNVATDLVASYNSTSVLITSSDGTDANIEAAVANGDAGVMTGADKAELSAATAAIASPDSTTYNDMTGSEPANASGQVYYANNTLNLGSTYGTLLQIGQELYTEVSNATGTTIPEGSAVYQAGVSQGLPSIALALADSYNTSIVIGITTMDIADGAKGLVTTFGNVNGLNTNGITTDVLVYLSDVVAGGLTTTAPNIATVIGSVLVADLTAGVLGVRVASNIALPTIFAGIKGATVPTSLPADLGTPTSITNYSDSTEVVMTSDTAAGTIDCSVDGTYRANISVDIAFDNVGGAGKQEIYLAVRNVTLNTIIDEIKGFILKDAETYSFSSNGLVDLVAGYVYRLELRSEIALTNLTFTQSNFDLESVHIR